MLKTIAFVCILLGPTQLWAHNWLDYEPDLTDASVVAVLEAVETLEIAEILNAPSQDDAFDFFTEISIYLNDESGTAERVLFMFEAIRTGVIDANGKAPRGLGGDWFQQIATRDYEHVLPHYERLNTWFLEYLKE